MELGRLLEVRVYCGDRFRFETFRVNTAEMNAGGSRGTKCGVCRARHGDVQRTALSSEGGMGLMLMSLYPLSCPKTIPL
eukprot:SAG11_NODE_11_length_27870_cov_16.327428_17_plen_79_part_00